MSKEQEMLMFILLLFSLLSLIGGLITDSIVLILFAIGLMYFGELGFMG